jgi:hypothetical protein
MPRVSLLVLASLTLPPAVDAQLRMMTARSEAGQVYQILQYRAGEDLGVGIDELRVTSVSANSDIARTCFSPPMSAEGTTSFEALAYGPIGGGRPLDLAFKSRLIADASVPCFSSSAADGIGRVCIGPGCTPECECPPLSGCEQFTVFDGTPLSTATPESPAAHLVTPLRVAQVHCNVTNESTFGFGTPTFLTTRADLCSPAPADGLRLTGTPSAFDGGTAGSTLILTYTANPDEQIAVAAAGFGIDIDGHNPFDCDAPGRVVAAFASTGEDGPSEPPPGPPVELDAIQQACQRAIARAGRRFGAKVLRSMQYCRDRILDRTWAIQAVRCAEQPTISRAITVAAKMARAAIAARCARNDMSRLLTCGDRVDDLITPDGMSGCLFDTHRNLAELLAIVEYGF